VKPSQAPSVLATVRESSLAPDALCISIMAGVSTSQLESMLGRPNPWVRAMPNTPCVVGEGMTVVAAGRGATPEHLAVAQRIFSAVGRSEIVEEHYCNAITALSGADRPTWSRDGGARRRRRSGSFGAIRLTSRGANDDGLREDGIETNRHPASLETT
jgi:pyrroline-5-carboxylate reductase